MSVFLSFNERIYSLMNKCYVDEFCYQKPIINYSINYVSKRNKILFHEWIIFSQFLFVIISERGSSVESCGFANDRLLVALARDVLV